MSMYLALLVCVIGLIMFFAAKTNPDVKELGRLAYFAGLIVFLFQTATHVVKF